MQKKKSGIMKSGLDAMSLFLLDDLLNLVTQAKTVLILHIQYCYTSTEVMLLRNAKVKTFGAIQYVSLHSFIEVCNLGNCMGKQIKYSVSTKTLIHEFCTFFRVQDSVFSQFFLKKGFCFITDTIIY